MNIHLHTTIDYKKLIELQAKGEVSKVSPIDNKRILDINSKKISKGYQKGLKMMKK